MSFENSSTSFRKSVKKMDPSWFYIVRAKNTFGEHGKNSLTSFPKSVKKIDPHWFYIVEGQEKQGVKRMVFSHSMLRQVGQYLTMVSEDLLIDLGMFFHIYFGCRLTGKYEGWTDVPLTWYAKRSNIGYIRAQNSLDNLLKLGVIEEHPDNKYSKSRKSVKRFRCVPLKDGWFEQQKLKQAEEYRKARDEMIEKILTFPGSEELEVLPVGAEVEEQEPEPVVVVFERPKSKARHDLKKHPPSSGGTPMVEVVDWDTVFHKVTHTLVSPEVARGLPTCWRCGQTYHPDSGESVTDDSECVECYIKRVLDRVSLGDTVNVPGEEVFVTYEFKKQVLESVKK